MIVGAGHAGGSAAALLRQFGWQGSIAMFGAEPVPPYQRPPLSKAWLKGASDLAGVLLRPATFYASNDIALNLASQAAEIDRASRSLTLGTGKRVPYDHLILALGARARVLSVPGHALAGVFELRTVADADRLRAALRPGLRLAVIGAGYIGLEAAASARTIGAEVTVIEREARVLARVASPLLSEYMQRRHETAGLRFVLDAAVEAFEGSDGRVAGVRLSDGEHVPCDAVLIGTGAAPNDALARVAGLTCADGIVVDAVARTSDPAIQAIGDCTYRSLPRYRRTGRLESVPNALEQAKQAAAELCRRPPPAPEVPWFWSDQYRRAAADRRPAFRCGRERGAWGACVWSLRDFPPGRRRRRAGGGGGQCTHRVHGRPDDDCQQEAGCGRQTARRDKLDAAARRLERRWTPGRCAAVRPRITLLRSQGQLVRASVFQSGWILRSIQRRR